MARNRTAGRRDGGTAGAPPDDLTHPSNNPPQQTAPSDAASRRHGLARFIPRRLASMPTGRLFGFAALAITLLVTLSGCIGGDERPYTTLDPATSAADDIQGLYKTLFYMGTVVFIFVQFLILYTALRYRRKRRSAHRPAQVHGNSRLELTWTIIPAVVLLVIFIPTVAIIYDQANEADATDGAMTIDVFGKQWWWEVHYPGLATNDQDLITANEVRLPVDTKVIFHLESNNVIHSFWVPQLAGKVDVMPGSDNKMAFTTPSEPGEYYGECAEFCGVDHAWMRFKVIVMSQADFDAWVQAWNTPPVYDANPGTADIAEGPPAFGACLACHRANGTQASIAPVGYEGAYTAGPNLTLFGCRESFAGGLMLNTPENLRAWLEDPNAVKPDNLMGTAIKEGALNDQLIDQLVAYLLSLRMPDGSCPADLADSQAEGAQPAQPGQPPANVDAASLAAAATPAASPAASPEAGATPVASPAAVGGGAPPATGPIVIEAVDINFVQKDLTIAANTDVQITLQNNGAAVHDFTIDNPAVSSGPVQPGQSVTFTVNLPPGTYEFYCSQPGHKQAGMVGTLTVQ